MVSAEPYLKTQQVARELGVSASTIKRWVDSGMIRAARTVGKHRLIPMSEAVRLVREQGLSETQAVGLGDVADERIVAMLEQSLRDGRTPDAIKLIHSLYATGWRAAKLADRMIRPVMERIGHGWMIGALDVYQEHEASLAVAAALQELIDRTVTPPVAPDRWPWARRRRAILMSCPSYSASWSSANRDGRYATWESIYHSAPWPTRPFTIGPGWSSSRSIT